MVRTKGSSELAALQVQYKAPLENNETCLEFFKRILLREFTEVENEDELKNRRLLCIENWTLHAISFFFGLDSGFDLIIGDGGEKMTWWIWVTCKLLTFTAVARIVYRELKNCI